MKAQDLTIGDWVYRVDFKEPVPVRILGLEVVNYDTHPKQYVADVFCPKHNNNVGLYMEEICPIPITAEILEKNGFKKELSEDNIHYRFILIYDGVRFSLLYAQSVLQWLGPLDFKYVHELQHVLRLCGIEKEIEL